MKLRGIPELSSPMESGSCCNMLEERRRSSSPSQPEMSRSTVSILFFDTSRYTSCFNFPIDLIARETELLEQIELLIRALIRDRHTKQTQSYLSTLWIVAVPVSGPGWARPQRSRRNLPPVN